MSAIRIRKKVAFSAVPDTVFSLKMSHTAIVILGWALGRPDGWTFYVEHMMKVLNLSDRTWPKAKKQLVTAGFFLQKKERNEFGKITWSNEFTDAPLWTASSIPPVCKDGEGSDAKGGDLPEVAFSTVLLTTPQPPKHGGGFDLKQPEVLSEFVEAAALIFKSGGGVIKNEIAWRRRVRNRIQKEGPSIEDIQAHNELLLTRKKYEDEARERLIKEEQAVAAAHATRVSDIAMETAKADFLKLSVVEQSALTEKFKLHLQHSNNSFLVKKLNRLGHDGINENAQLKREFELWLIEYRKNNAD